MNTKTPGQACFTAWNETESNRFVPWEKSEYKQCWEAAAAAVIAHHEAQKQPWTLPAPPEGREWHRTDWTAEMLPDGWRPLSINEFIDTSDQFMSVNTGRWTSYGSNNHDARGSIGRVAMAGQSHVRTRRPLPPTHEIKITLPQLTLDCCKWSFASI